MADDPAAALAGIRERHALAVTPDPDPVFFGSLFKIKSHLVRIDVPRLLAAVEAALKATETPTPLEGRGFPGDGRAVRQAVRAAITAALAAAQATEAGDG
jgi:hypothetical protein